jgi:membrane protease subunit (stomatin/prohibitin family)
VPRIFDIIEYFDETGKEMVHRIPEEGSGDFRLGSQCIVRESQAAVFFRDGKALDILGPGRHTLSTANVPVLTRLLGIAAFSGQTPFKAEVDFVNLREFIDQKWGTPEPITLRDPDLGMVRLRAFGTYSMQVSDPQMFVNKIVGTQGMYDTNQIQGFLRGMIISRLIDLLGEAKRSILDLPAMFDELSAGTRAKLQDDFTALGVALKTLYINSISPTDETAKAIDERASMGAIGDMRTYMQFKAARAMGDAAQAGGGGGQAGNLTGAGLGLGAGVGLGSVMAQMMGQALQQGQQPPAGGAAPAGTPGGAPGGGGTPSAPALVTCPACHAEVPPAKFCNSCGAKLDVPAKAFCSECGKEMPAGSKFCPSCGAKQA